LNEKKEISCYKCKYFYITWDKNFPNGCKALGFKTAKNPAQVVYESSGMICLAYSPKPEKSREDDNARYI